MEKMIVRNYVSHFIDKIEKGRVYVLVNRGWSRSMRPVFTSIQIEAKRGLIATLFQ